MKYKTSNHKRVNDAKIDKEDAGNSRDTSDIPGKK